MTPMSKMIPAVLVQTRKLPLLFSRSQPMVSSLKRSFHTSKPALRVEKSDPFFSSPFFRFFTLVDKRPDDQQIEKIYSKFNEQKEKEQKEKEKLLFKAAEKGDLAGIKQLVNQGADIYCAENDFGQTVLMIAAKKGHIHIMEYCLLQTNNDDFSSIRRENAFLRQKIGNHGEFIDRTDNFHRTALYLAVLHGKWDACNFLIRNGAYLEVNKLIRNTMLMLVISNGNLEQVKTFLKAGASCHSNLYGETPLMCSIERSKYDIASYLIKTHKADPNVVDDFGKSALSVAVMVGHFSMVKLLLVNGASPYKGEWYYDPEYLARQKKYDHMANYIKSFKNEHDKKGTKTSRLEEVDRIEKEYTIRMKPEDAAREGEEAAHAHKYFSAYG